MLGVTDPAGRVSTDAAPAGDHEYNLVGSAAVTVLAGVLLAVCARTGAVALLVAVGVVQSLLTLAWVLGASVPGRVGGILLAGAAAAGADVTVSIWPHSRLGTLLVVFGLAVPVLFVHQVVRGAARVRLVESLGDLALLVVADVAAAALLQLRHEWSSPHVGGVVVAGVVTAAAGALVVGFLVDLITPAPHFDPQVPRGLLAVVGSAGVGGSIGHLMLRANSEFVGGRGAFVGAAVGALAGFLAVAVAFVEASTPMPDSGVARRMRPVLAAVAPIALAAPVAYLLCLAVRV
jgi:hypothetical protein